MCRKLRSASASVREAPCDEQCLEGRMLGEERRSGFRADTARARDLVRGIASQSDEVRHLRGLHAVSLPYLRGPDPGELAHPLHGLEDRHVVRRKLERVAVGGGDERRATGSALGGDGRGEEVVGFEARRLRACDSRGAQQAGCEIELLEKLRVELAPRLVAGEHLVAVRRHGEGVPADEDRSRALRLPEPKHHRGEAGEQVARAAVRASDRSWQRMERAVGEGVAVDHEQRSPRRAVSLAPRRHGADPTAASSSAAIDSRSRSVAVCAASATSSAARSSVATA